ncbi:SLATT domain-containing protein [Aquimarina sp. MMG016]|uniref:SMODS domain-containing nucleotidyltransferase n=1 Tax=Aquimarina sp. MMG016 TaxID=2822690 RepID=UPI001B3A0CFD|nr:SLATT domain-containing protein [Aquimarina sp. MMG016]MBQ4821972.1 SLATT domain-containing protein [Aquimarina sp. MMG016]
MSVSANFNTFCDNLTISEEKQAIISLRFNSICEKLNKVYWNLNSTYGGIYIGSYGRRTVNSWANEVEMMFEMPIALKQKVESYGTNVQSAFLNDVRERISEIYPSAVVDKEKNTVAVIFSDKLKIHVLPVFRDKREVYLKADLSSGGSWKMFDPISEVKAINLGNQITNNNLQQLCKMIHSWKRNCNVPIKDVLLDTFAYDFLMQWQHRNCHYKNYDLMCVEFFEYLKNQKPSKISWEVLGSGRVIKNVENFRYKAIVAYYNTKNAIDLQRKNKYWKSRQKWREIFGNKFPESILLENQIKKLCQKVERFHKAELKCANILRQKGYISKATQVFFATMIVIGLMIIGNTDDFNLGVIVFGVSVMLFVFNLYVQRFNFSTVIRKHKESAIELLDIQKQYRNLLYELNNKNTNVAILREKKEVLQSRLRGVYSGTSVFISKTYLETSKIFNRPHEISDESSVPLHPKIKVPIWQGNKFFMEQQEQNLLGNQ